MRNRFAFVEASFIIVGSTHKLFRAERVSISSTSSCASRSLRRRWKSIKWICLRMETRFMLRCLCKLRINDILERSVWLSFVEKVILTVVQQLNELIHEWVGREQKTSTTTISPPCSCLFLLFRQMASLDSSFRSVREIFDWNFQHTNWRN